jgi:hypothetical protein
MTRVDCLDMYVVFPWTSGCNIEVVMFKVKLQKINRHSPEVEIKGKKIPFGLKEKRRGLEG